MSRRREMAAFDELPRSARAALAASDFNWKTTGLLAAHRRAETGYRTGPELAERVARRDWITHRADVREGVTVAPKLDSERANYIPRRTAKGNR